MFVWLCYEGSRIYCLICQQRKVFGLAVQQPLLQARQAVCSLACYSGTIYAMDEENEALAATGFADQHVFASEQVLLSVLKSRRLLVPALSAQLQEARYYRSVRGLCSDVEFRRHVVYFCRAKSTGGESGSSVLPCCMGCRARALPSIFRMCSHAAKPRALTTGWVASDLA